jgi:hypothetical protein
VVLKQRFRADVLVILRKNAPEQRGQSCGCANLGTFKEIWENCDYYGYNIRDENAPWYKQVWQTIVHGFGDLTPISVSSAQRALDTGGTWSKDVVLAVLGFGPAPSYAERSAIQNPI